MARDDHQLKFRVPEGLKRRIEQSAEANARSFNAEIVFALEMAYPDFLPQAREKFARIYSLIDALSPGDDEKKAEIKSAIDDYLSFMSSDKVWLAAEGLAKLDEGLK